MVDLDGLAGELLAPGGRLAMEKIFTRSDVIVAVAPRLHGLVLSTLDDAVEVVLAHADAVALPRVSGVREPVWSAACVLADEDRVAELAETLAGRDGARVHWSVACDAIEGLTARLGSPLTDTQRGVAMGLLTAGHALDVVVGIAGSGKTTTLSAVRAGFEGAGYQVVGAATSGQAAKTLGEGAGIESRTVASLTWRLDHGQLALTDRRVVVLDEGGMTPDVDVARLAGAVERAGAKLIVVGDDRQLSPVGPGGALGALVDRHPDHVWRLTDNLRQTDPTERTALEELRAGQTTAAVDWYSAHDRIHAERDTRHAVEAMVDRWADDAEADRDVIMLAYRRDSVEALNRAARTVWDGLGRLSGLELVAPGGRAYRAGDRIITLAPGAQGAWVTSQAATVTAVNPQTQTIHAITADGQRLVMGSDDIGADKLAWGYAMTAHRSQGATVDVAHVLADGGGRELAYVAMSRAREVNHVYVVTPNPAQASERLSWNWDQQRRHTWVAERVHADSDPAERTRPFERIAHLQAERDLLIRSVPPDSSDRLADLQAEQAAVERSLADLHAGADRWKNTAVETASIRLADARRAHQQVAVRAGDRYPGLWARHKARQAEQATATELRSATAHWNVVVGHQVRQLQLRRDRLTTDVNTLINAQTVRQDFLTAQPDLLQRIARLDHQIGEAERLQTPTRRPVTWALTPAPQTRLDQHPDARQSVQPHQTVPAPEVHRPRITL